MTQLVEKAQMEGLQARWTRRQCAQFKRNKHVARLMECDWAEGVHYFCITVQNGQ